ncbi:MAG TPA: SUMF1/EgtB/PvdO family nonheme iron enzyme [Brumimicrobium sp.]|nr:SUMF1/EgtB/PvdO family nonheme iron enzyme [Brumimicrobium sp.]
MKKTSYFLLAALFVTSTISLTIQNTPSAKDAMKKLKNEFGYIPSGSVILEDKNQSVQAFYMSKTVVTNREYQEFLNYLKKNGDKDKYEIAKIDTVGWRNIPNKDLQSYAKEYHRNSAYNFYPVVNVSKEGAALYCEWFTEQMNKMVPEDKQMKFRLPLKAEWLRAAEGTNSNKVYAWEGPYLRNDKGQILANFAKVLESSISRNEKGELIILKDLPISSGISKSVDVIAPTDAYWPNEFGLYNLNGNVSEMLADKEEVIGGSWYDGGYDIRNRSTKIYDGPSALVGFRIVATAIN